MKNALRICIVVGAFGFAQIAAAVPILLADYDPPFGINVNETNYVATTVAAGFTASNTSLAGVAAGSFTQIFHTTGWDTTQNLAKYVSISISANSGDVEFNRIETIMLNFSDNQNVSNAYHMAIRSSADSFAANIDTKTSLNSFNHIPVTFDLSALGAQSGVTEFRVYYWNVGGVGNPMDAGWSGSSINGNNPAFSIFGEAAQSPGPQPVPEPGTLTLLGLGLAGIGLARRRKKS